MLQGLTADAVMEIERAYANVTSARAGAKQAVVRERFGLSETRYTQRLNVLLDDPEFIELDPVLVRTLRSRRERFRRARR